MERRSWVNFQCRGVLLVWIIVRQGPIALAVGASGGCLDMCTLIYPFSPLSPSLWETSQYRLKYCLKGPLNPKQPINQPTISENENTIVNVKKLEAFFSAFLLHACDEPSVSISLVERQGLCVSIMATCSTCWLKNKTIRLVYKN